MSSELESYLRQVRDRQARLDLSVFQEGQERDFDSVALDQFYVPLRIAGQLPVPEDEQSERIKAERPDIQSNQLLNPQNNLGPHLTLLGDAGSGKTTILRHLCGALAHANLGQNMDFARQQTGLSDNLLTPIFIPLRHYHHFCNQATPKQSISWGSFLEFLAHYFQENYNLSLKADFYQHLLNSGRCLLALDGFDELPADSGARRQVINLIRNMAADTTVGHNSIILSSRQVAYGGNTQLGSAFQTLWVQNLNAAERSQQIKRWVAGINPLTERQLKADDILGRMPPDSPLAQLAVTPMIVTTMCVVYFYDHKLPEQRAQLYRRCVDIMLYEKLRPDEPGQTLADLAGKPDFKRQLLARLAFAMHQAGKDEVNKEQAARWLKDGFKSVAETDRLETAYTFLETITSRGTLLQERSHLFGFGRQHLTFQEFLTGYHLILGLRPRERQKLWPGLMTDDRWREPIRLAAGAAVSDNTLTCEDFLEELLEFAAAEEANPPARLAGIRLAAESLWDLGQSGRDMLEKSLQSKIINSLVDGLAEKAITNPAADLLKERLAAALVLGHLGDPRAGVATLPPLLTHPIEGKFEYGPDKTPQETPPFRAGVYLVTNAQFKLFMTTGGYEKKEWWSEAGLEWLKKPPDYRNKPITQPEYWEDERFNNPNQPVVGVSWYEAEAFCNWLTAIDEAGLSYRLPTETEWERLARGQHGREYPWGNTWTDGLGNTSEANLKQSSTVGLFPAGISPTGAYDCAGNVWEWCLDWLDEKEQTFRVLRGGSWNDNQVKARCVVRLRNNPHYSNYDRGFRVVSPIF